MRRRAFISLVGGALVAWPRAVIAQVSSRRALIAVLAGGSSTLSAGLSQGLQELGYAEGQNIDIVYRYSEGDKERIPLLADQLVRLKPDVIVVTDGTDVVVAVKQATATIPIVSTVLSEVSAALGLSERQARPGGQVTGILTTLEGLTGKQLELLHELVPGAARIGMTFNTRMRAHTIWHREVKAAAHALGVTIVPVEIRTANDLAAGFQNHSGRPALRMPLK